MKSCDCGGEAAYRLQTSCCRETIGFFCATHKPVFDTILKKTVEERTDLRCGHCMIMNGGWRWRDVGN